MVEFRGRPFVAVVGGRRCSREESTLAEEIGAELARRRAVLVCGGLSGVMAACCRGAHSFDGLTVGILPGHRRQAANPYVDIPIVTGMGEARNVIVAKSVQAVIAIGGKYGTLTEIGHALLNGIPVIGLSTWSLARNSRYGKAIIVARDPRDAVDKALAAVEQKRDC